jgi:hypothetical protein
MPVDDQDLQSSSAVTWRFKKYCIMLDFEDDKNKAIFEFLQGRPSDVAVEFLLKVINGIKGGGATCCTGRLVFVPRQCKLNRRSIDTVRMISFLWVMVCAERGCIHNIQS